MRKKNALKKAAPSKRFKEANVQPFEIEKDPPGYRLNPDLTNVLSRIEETVKLLKPGQAFIAPSKSRHSIKKFMEERWPYYKFMYSVLKDGRGLMRIYFIKKLEPNS